MTPAGPEDELDFTVRAVWSEERVSCPHPNVLRAFLDDALPEGAQAFLRFHLQESQCPYCNAAVEEMQARDREAGKVHLEDLKDRLLRSTVSALRQAKK